MTCGRNSKINIPPFIMTSGQRNYKINIQISTVKGMNNKNKNRSNRTVSIEIQITILFFCKTFTCKFSSFKACLINSPI